MITIRRYDTFGDSYNLLIPESKPETNLLLILSIEFQKAINEKRTTYDEMEKKISENLELIRATRQKLINR